jgi:putative NIF3 family GTP cyclohydrolase 1 type 2
VKVKEVIDKIIQECGGIKFEKTCDLIIAGDEESEVTGIVTTFMATVEVIEQTIDMGANLIITHEPTYYTGDDRLDWIDEDPVYLKKKELIEKNNITIWRFHDHMHAAPTDMIYDGLMDELGWRKYLVTDLPFPHVYKIPKTTLCDLVKFFKVMLEMETIQIVGDPEMNCENVGILVGGGSLGLGVEEMPMQFIEKHNLDVVVCGDIIEWTLTPYIRDAVSFGMNKAMLVLGHERSEEAGMKYLATWIKNLLDEVSVSFIDAKEPFTYL